MLKLLSSITTVYYKWLTKKKKSAKTVITWYNILMNMIFFEKFNEYDWFYFFNNNN